MKKYLIIKFQVLFLLTALATAPALYAQKKNPLTVTPEKSAPRVDEQRERVDFLLFIRTELFFGRNKPDGTEISEEEFAEFLSEVITPEFPDGLTVLDGIGQFRDAAGTIIREKAKVLILLYPQDARRPSSRKIERIREAYKARFNQQSVLRVDEHLAARVSF